MSTTPPVPPTKGPEELAEIERMLNEGQGDDDGMQIMPDFDEGMSTLAKVETCLHLLEKRRDVIAAYVADENWRDDPSADERWNAGLDFGMSKLCAYLGVDPAAVTWDAATETLDGDVCAVIGNILRAKYGDDWGPLSRIATKGPEDDLIAALEFYADRANWTNDEQVNRDEIFDTAMSLDEHGSRARAALLALRSRPASALPVVGEWRSDWENAPKDKTIIAVGRYGDEWGGPNEYVYAGPPNHWSCKFHGVCIRPDYWDRYVFIVKPELPEIAALTPSVQP